MDASTTQIGVIRFSQRETSRLFPTVQCCKEPYRHCGENFLVKNIYTQVCILE